MSQDALEVMFVSHSLHYALSNVIIRDQKFLKVKHYYELIFERKQLNFFLGMKNCPNIEANIFSRTNCDKFWHFLAKNLKGWSEKLETWHVETLDPVLKKVRKQQFFPGSPSL